MKSLPYDDKIILSKVRLEKAKECLTAAKLLLAAQDGLFASNRSYYAVFHAMRAVLVFDDYDSKKHSGIISEFRKRYIKTGIFEDDLSRIIGDQFDMRSHSDYDDFYTASREEIESQYHDAEYFVETIEQYLIEIYEQSNTGNGILS